MSKKSYLLTIVENSVFIGERANKGIGPDPILATLDLDRLLLSLQECGYKIEPPPSILYNQVKEYILSAWSKDCIDKDTGTELVATNTHLMIMFLNAPGGTPYLQIRDNDGTRFNGYIRGIADFKTVLELVSVQKPEQ